MYFQSDPRVTRTKMKGLDHLSNPLKTMVSAAGLEPTTHSLGNCCSILMSYADTLI